MQSRLKISCSDPDIRLLIESILNSFASMASSKCPARVPEWLLADLLKPIEGSISAAGDTARAIAQALDKAFEAMVEESANQIRELFTTS